MGSNKYNLIVNSAKISKQNIAVARTKANSLLQLQQSQLDKLFSGRPVRIFKDVEHKVAQRYRDAIEKIGLECLIETSTKQQESSVAPPQASDSNFTSFSLEEKVTTQKPKNYFCPTCQLQQTSKNICEHCNCNLETYRGNMELKGFIESPDAGYIQDRRIMHRRSDKVRRETLRMGNNSDRRIPEERRKDFGAYQFAH